VLKHAWGTVFSSRTNSTTAARRAARKPRLKVESLDERLVPATVGFQFASSSPTEGNSPTYTPFAVSIRLDQPLQGTQPATVYVRTTDGTGAHKATADVDYVKNTWQVTFNPGDQSATLSPTPSVIGDNVAENDETFDLEIYNVTVLSRSIHPQTFTPSQSSMMTERSRR